MAIDFNATTSKLEHTTANLGITSKITVCTSIFADGQGESGFGSIITIPETAGTCFNLNHKNVANTLRIYADWSGTDGQWSIPATDAQWNFLAVSYDGSGTSNNPIARVNFQNVTVTQNAVPTGTWNSAGTGFCVGAHTNGQYTWDGMICPIQVFNEILTPGEMDQACRLPGSVRRGMQLFLRMSNKDDLVDLSGNGFNGTGTALTNRVGGPSYGLLYTDGQITLMADGFSRKLLYMGVG